MGGLSVTTNAKYQEPFQPLIPGVSVGRLNEDSSLELVNEDTCAVIVEPIQVSFYLLTRRRRGRLI